MKACIIEGCEFTTKRLIKGMCNTHYRRMMRNGDPSVLKRRGYAKGNPRLPNGSNSGTCSVEGCEKSALAKTLCAMHHARWRKHGDVHTVLTAPAGSGHVNRDGYLRITVDGRTISAHRHVMQEALGRPLWPDENVHHINGDRLDNRLENLELWSTSQPPGQRVGDKITWAHELLERYAPHLLSAVVSR